MSEVDAVPAVDLLGSTFEAVLEPTRRGTAEIDKPAFGLSRNQRLLLRSLDGARSLRDCVANSDLLNVQRLPRDAARLVAFGLAKVVAGELPQALIVEAMNLTQCIPLDRLRPLAPERQAAPMQPRVAASGPRASAADAPRRDVASGQRRSHWSWLLMLLLLVSMIVAGIWPLH